MKTLKSLFGALSNAIANHGATIIAVLICTIFFLVHSLVKDIDHYSEVFKLELEKVELNNELGQVFDLVDGQSRTIETQSNQLEESDSALRIQSTIIRQLIERLKFLGEWPPNVEPIDPDKIT